ncbi:SDR family oxidoreductase [Streptomyces lichenis]|uniref:SDR family oxidoreductase n=1 Tax=Streptomyces lichenis TaxID=2306967 RepID=A0ABT0IF49_9ACTN|nr:SDR family oxidoreductase [Streptomyces lichenis]MCK8679962.1 SDR family oxidoreductase [Streptomyces lichenis]
MTGPSPGAEFAGRIALVTGGAGSVGRVVVERLAERGATVLLNCFHSYGAAKEQVRALTGRGLDVRLIRASVARPEQVERMFGEIGEEHGRLDILVNNAAAGSFVPFDEITEELLDRTYATNVKGPLWCARHARPLLAAAGGTGAAIVNVSSLGAATAPANYLPVGVSKAALEALTRYLAAELAGDRIRVNAASCGLIDNPVGQLFPSFEDVRANTVAATPLARLGRPEDLAEVVLFLSSERSGWVTGQTLLADGGLTLLRSAMSPTANEEPAAYAEPAAYEEPTVLAEPAALAQPVAHAEPTVPEAHVDPAALAGRAAPRDTASPREPAPPAPAAVGSPAAHGKPTAHTDSAVLGRAVSREPIAPASAAYAEPVARTEPVVPGAPINPTTHAGTAASEPAAHEKPTTLAGTASPRDPAAPAPVAAGSPAARVERAAPAEPAALAEPGAHGSAAHEPGAHGSAAHEPGAHGSAAHEPGAHGSVAHEPGAHESAALAFPGAHGGPTDPHDPAALAFPAAHGEPTDPHDPVAVVGMGMAVPGASSPEEFWRLLCEGAELFVDAPADRWDIARFHDEDRRAPDKTYQRRSGFITSFRPHDKLRAEGLADAGLDHTALWLRHSLHQALDGVRRADGDRFSFCVGYTPDGSQHLEESYVLGHALDTLAEDGDEAVRGPVGDALRGRFGRGGAPGEARHPHRVGRDAMDGILPGDTRLHMVDTACSSSLYAMDLGVRDLLSGRSDIAVCGGSFALAPSGSILFAKLNGLSAGGAVHALDAGADGALFSDGAGLVVLKRLSRARADGDRVLGLISAIGLSADGRGKAIYAPAPAGQELAVERAFERGGLGPDDIDWIVAHATGTPAGDEAEFTSLARRYAGTRVQQVTSNKSLVGHCGWAAGVVSVIHTLLALRHGTIPAQYRFSRLPDALAGQASGLTVPREPVPWPAEPGRPRRAAVSGFGFGGTNAHVIISEDHRAARTGRPPALPAPLGEDLVLVGWSAHLPGAPAPEEVAAWAAGSRDEEFEPSFGATYPVPPFQELRMPPPTARATDRTQLALVRCMQGLPEPVRELCLSHNRTTGVVVGHTGATRNALLYKSRAYLDEIGRVVADAGDRPGTEKFLRRLEERATGLIAAPTEDSFPGEMPNVIAARLSNYFDLRGLNITVDAGEASLLEAFDVAGSYLDFREIDVALVAGVNGTALPGWNDEPGRRAAEAAFLFALTRRSLAERTGLPVLAVVERSVAA